MAVSLNSVVGFNPSAKYPHASRTCLRAAELKSNSTSSLSVFGIGRPLKTRTWILSCVAADGDRIMTNTADKNLSTAESINPSDNAVLVNSQSLTSSADVQPNSEAESSQQSSPVSNGSVASTSLKEDQSSNPKLSNMKKSRLTAREKLRAARVLSRYNESKPSKGQLGSKLIDAMRESEKGKKGLPQAPSNLFDDSKRGMPKEGWTFEFPGGFDIFLIVFSFVFISTVMFATTYVVWKVGAIHFNEY